MSLSDFPRIPLSHLPTPIEKMSNLSAVLDGPDIYIKRDDCTGLATGGNKARKLEYLMGDALEKGADTILTVGGLQSNHARQTAAAATKLGLNCELLLENIPGTPKTGYDSNGNILLDKLMGAEIHMHPAGAPLADLMQARCKELTAAGKKPYAVPMGGSSAIGSLGYTRCAEEIIDQCKNQNLDFDYIVVSTGSCGTQAGLLTGFARQGIDMPVIGINVSATDTDQIAKLRPVLDETCTLLGLNRFSDDKLICKGNYFHPGYGVPNEGTIDALKLLASTEAILLDPVYTGKGMAGLIDLVKTGFFKKEDKILFIHTGGQAALFPYESMITS